MCARREIQFSPAAPYVTQRSGVLRSGAGAGARVRWKRRLLLANALTTPSGFASDAASPNELKLSSSYLEQERQRSRATLHTSGIAPAHLDAVEQRTAAAWVGLASSFLNTDEFITRE